MLGINLERVVFASHKDSICSVSSAVGDIALYIRDDTDKALVRKFLEGVRCMDTNDFERCSGCCGKRKNGRKVKK